MISDIKLMPNNLSISPTMLSSQNASINDNLRRQYRECVKKEKKLSYGYIGKAFIDLIIV